MLQTIQYSLDLIKDEVHQLVEKGILGKQQPLYTICQFIPAREWGFVEKELEKNGYLLRDRIVDLLQHETWDSD